MKKLLASAMLVCATQMWAPISMRISATAHCALTISSEVTGGINVMLDGSVEVGRMAGRRHHLNETPLPATAQSL